MRAISDALTDAVHMLMRETSESAILPHYQRLSNAQIMEKGPNDVVTVADHQSEQRLSDGLSQLIPEAKIVGEEGVHQDPEHLKKLSQLCWIIDPLDGTMNFAEGKPPFGVLIALCDGGEAIAGWIYDCLTQRFCWTLKGVGAFADGERVRAKTTGNTPPVAANSLIYLADAERAAIEQHVAPHYQLADIPRCAAEQYPRLALGQNDVALFKRTLPWDHAAGALWLNEAGGKAARPDGSPYRVDETDRVALIGASNARIWADFAKRLEASSALLGGG